MAKHLSLSERAFIERALVHEKSFAEIAKQLNRSATTISREVKSHRVFVQRFRDDRNDCILYPSCLRRNLCPTESIYSCINRCKFCQEYDCRELYPGYQSPHCPKLEKPPYVCTGCEQQKTCKRNHAYYTAHRANAAYKKELRDARIGIRTTPERLVEIGELLTPLVAKGQSINHILATHKEEIGLSEKTIYNYIDANAFSVKNIDLPKKVAYRQRKTKPILTKMEYKFRHGRTYEAFNEFLEMNPGISVVEMDTVKSAQGCKKMLLTMIFRNSNFMLVTEFDSKLINHNALVVEQGFKFNFDIPTVIFRPLTEEELSKQVAKHQREDGQYVFNGAFIPQEEIAKMIRDKFTVLMITIRYKFVASQDTIFELHPYNNGPEEE